MIRDAAPCVLVLALTVNGCAQGNEAGDAGTTDAPKDAPMGLDAPPDDVAKAPDASAPDVSAPDASAPEVSVFDAPEPEDTHDAPSDLVVITPDVSDIATPSDARATPDLTEPLSDRVAPLDVPPPPPPPPPTLDDMLIQDVCVAADGTLLADDPWDGCPPGASARDLRLGEPLPYHRHDQPGPGEPRGYQRKDSYPRPGNRTVHTFDYPPFGEYNPERDGYDVVESDGDYASIIGTRDPTGLAQTFYGSGCALNDAWLLLPRTGFLTPGARTATLALVGWERAGRPFPGPCPSRYDLSITPYAPRRVTFGGVNGSTAKALDAVVVDHYGGGAIDTADHIERFYFTRVYGLTRWERWERDRGTPRAEGCSGATTEGAFRRLDCRDWTQVFADPTPTPPEVWPTPYAPSNVVRNHDFGGGTADAWERLGASTTGAATNLSILRDPDGNAHLATNCGGPCSPGQNIFQDVPRAGLDGALRFGLRIWTDAGEGAVELVVFQRDRGARILQRHSVPLTVTTARTWVASPTFTVDPAADHFRFTVYLNAPVTFRFDDAWISR